MAARSRWGIPSAAAAAASSRCSSTSSGERAGGTAWRRCASAWGRGSRPWSSGSTSHEAANVSRALVLGGGGITGIAWEAGVLMGLRERGVDTQSWDLVVGTSAGSVVGAKVQAEPDFEAWFAAQLLEATRADDRPIEILGGRVATSFLRLGRVGRLGWVPRIWLTAFAIETFVRHR